MTYIFSGSRKQKRKQRRVRRMMRSVSYDYSVLDIRVTFENTKGDIFGWYKPSERRIIISRWFVDWSPKGAFEFLKHEAAHAIDHQLMTIDQREAIHSLMCSHQPRHDWVKYYSSADDIGDEYQYLVGEAFAENGFDAAYCPDSYVATGYKPHPVTPEMGTQIKGILDAA